jgi:hypothetical protein
MRPPGPGMRLADCGDGVYCGDRHACDVHGDRFDLVVHGWSDLNIREGRLCRCVRDSLGWGLPVMIREGEPPESWGRSLGEVAAYLARPGRVLCHCAGGSVRGPTLALVAKLVRRPGRHPADAVRDVAAAMWRDCRATPHLMPATTEAIFRWAGR